MLSLYHLNIQLYVLKQAPLCHLVILWISGKHSCQFFTVNFSFSCMYFSPVFICLSLPPHLTLSFHSVIQWIIAALLLGFLLLPGNSQKLAQWVKCTWLPATLDPKPKIMPYTVFSLIRDKINKNNKLGKNVWTDFTLTPHPFLESLCLTI